MEPDRFFLAIVSGLEEGYKTTVRLIPHPLKSLDWAPSTQISLAAIADARPAYLISFTDDPEL